MTYTKYHVSWTTADETRGTAFDSLDEARAALAEAIAAGATLIRQPVEGGGDCAILRRTTTVTDQGYEP